MTTNGERRRIKRRAGARAVRIGERSARDARKSTTQARLGFRILSFVRSFV